MKKNNLKFKKFFFLNFAFIIFIFEFLNTPVLALTEDLYEARLNKGLKHTEPYSYILIKKAQSDTLNAKRLLKEAIRYSPNLPAAYFEMARTSFSPSPDGIFESLDYVIQGFKAYKRNFWWLRSIVGLFLISLISSFLIVLVAIISIRFFIEAPLLSHDISEDKKKMFMVLSLFPLSLLGPLFFIIGAISLIGLYFRKIDKAVVYMAILLLVLSPFILHIANTFISVSSPEIRAIVAVNENKDNNHALSTLKGRNDFVSLFSYGIALKREGHYEEAIATYKKLLSSNPDSRVYVNLGNCYFGMNDMAAAKDSYKKAVEVKPLVSAYYNLSQASRETLDFEKGEEYFLEATRLDGEAVSRFTATSSRNPNRFVIDETLPMLTLWEYAYSIPQKSLRVFPLSSGAGLIAVILGLLFYTIDRRSKFRAYKCKRCGAILCGKCAKELLWGGMCSQCYKSIVKLDGLDPKERLAKVFEVQKRQNRRRNIVKLISFAPPGIAHIYSGRIFSGSLFLGLFLFLLILILLNPLLSAGLASFIHIWLIIPSLILMVVLYIISYMAVRRMLNRGWL